MNPLHEAMREVPALVGTGFLSLRNGRYVLAHVNDPERARAWLRDVLAAGLVKALAQVRVADDNDVMPAPLGGGRHQEAVTIAISYAGLEALGLKPDAARPFPSAFRAGMGHPVRRRLLGEDPVPGGSDDSFEPWDWSDQDGDHQLPVHLLVAHYWCDGPASSLLDPDTLAQRGLTPVRTVQADERAIQPSPDGRLRFHEPFGFQDGIGQPRLRGLAVRARRSAQPSARLQQHPDAGLVEPGEFLLGHRNEYRETSYSPDVAGWPRHADAPAHFAVHGSYLAVRQIRQHVAVFHAYTQQSPVARLASKMMGRRMTGWPLVTGPHEAVGRDDFLYLASDERGFECPRGAHVRRAHVRDALAHDEAEGIQSSALHRLLRRGRVYVNDREQSPTGDGIMFIALNADLDRQFEFVHRNWIMGSRFGDLRDEQDPILGTRPGRHFTVPGCPVGQRVGPLPRFTQVIGGGYFFLPGMSALRFVAGAQ